MSYEQSFICSLVVRIKTEVVGTYSFFFHSTGRNRFLLILNLKKQFKDFQPF